MTTVAYKDRVLAVDSRMSADNLIVSDNYNKIKQVGDCVFIFTGSVCDIDELLATYFGKSEPADLDAAALVYDREADDLSLIESSKSKGLMHTPLELDDVHTQGSGGDFALIAMDLGATAPEAIEVAATRDMCTGGAIRVVELVSNKVVAKRKAKAKAKKKLKRAVKAERKKQKEKAAKPSEAERRKDNGFFSSITSLTHTD